MFRVSSRTTFMPEQAPHEIITERADSKLMQAAVHAVEKIQKSSARTIWELFPEITERVEGTYAQLKAAGRKIHHHDLLHAKRVGEIAHRVALDEWGDEHQSHLAGIAGLVHNADRTIQAEKGLDRKKVPRDKVIVRIKNWIQGDLSETDMATVIDAVLGHDGKNAPEDSNVQIALQDGDRVVNLDADLLPRSGQFYSDLPVIDVIHFLADPEATYRHPKSVLRDIAYSLDWVNPESDVCVRTRLGKEMAMERARFFEVFFTMLKRQLREEGIEVE